MADNNLFSEQCILSLTTYDICRQQLCLTPEMLSIPFSAEGVEAIITADGESTIILPGTPAFLPTTVTSVRMVPNSFSTQIKISNVEPSQFLENYYTFEVMYIFTFKVQLFDAANNLIQVELDTQPNPTFQDFLTVGVSYIYNGNLCGGNSQDVVTATNFFAPEILYTSSLPFVVVNAMASTLKLALEEICPQDICSSSNNQLFADNYDPYDNPVNIIQPFIGLFAIYQLVRPIDLAVPSTLVTSDTLANSPYGEVVEDGCYPPPCVKMDPCTYFNSLPFPFTDFDPDNCDE